jgi:hypothetical protein
MGGIGTGSYTRDKQRLHTDNYLSLDLRTLRQRGGLNRMEWVTCSWRRPSGKVDAIEFKMDDDSFDIRYTVKRTNSGNFESKTESINLIKTPCNFGGYRYWFNCPCCREKCLVLYLGPCFLCRKCLNLVHPSSIEGKLYRACRKVAYYQDKLNPVSRSLTVLDSVYEIPKIKWGRYKTFYELQAKAGLAQHKLMVEYKRALGVL